MKEIRISTWASTSSQFEAARDWLKEQEDIRGAYNWEYEYYWAEMSDEQHLLFKLKFPGFGESM